MDNWLTYILAGTGAGIILYGLWKSVQQAPAQEIWEPEEPPATGIDTGINLPSIEEEMRVIDSIIKASRTAAAVVYGVAPSDREVKAIIDIESSWNPTVTGSANEIGLMQLKLSTAQWLGYSGSHADLYLPINNVRYGTYYLAYWKQRRMNQEQMASCYNAGHLEYTTDGKFKNQRYVEKFKRALEKY